MSSVEAFSAAVWLSDDVDDDAAFDDPAWETIEPEPVPPERLRPHFLNRALWRTRGPRRHLRATVVHVPQRREKVARPRERQPSTRRRTASRDGPSRLDPDDEPHLSATRRG